MRGPHDPDGNLAPIGDQKFGKHAYKPNGTAANTEIGDLFELCTKTILVAQKFENKQVSADFRGATGPESEAFFRYGPRPSVA
jgi:hypothetical protein